MFRLILFLLSVVLRFTGLANMKDFSRPPSPTKQFFRDGVEEITRAENIVHGLPLGVTYTAGLLSWPWKTLAACKAAAPNLEAEPHSENVVFVIETTSFGTYFDHFKGGVHDTRFLEPIYQ